MFRDEGDLMKKTSEDLAKHQEDTAVRRQLLESGKIRLIPQEPKSQADQEDEKATARKKDSR